MENSRPNQTYCGSGKTDRFENVKASVCLTDIPEDAIVTSEKNGKKYVTLIIGKNRQADKFGNTHFVKYDDLKWKKNWTPKESYPTPTPFEGVADAPKMDTSDDDLPF